MRRYIKLASLIVLSLVTCICLTNNIAYAESSTSLLKSVAVRSGNTYGTANLFGNGETFITDIKVEVNFNNHAPYEIPLEDGYSPSIETLDFGGDDKLLFYSSQTGGSGGYGNYQIYLLRPNNCKLVYDDKENSKDATFNAQFIPNGIMKITNEQTNTFLNVDVKFMDRIFYNRIFDRDGDLKDVEPYVNDISFVSPSLTTVSGTFRLITFRSVVAVAEVNRLGYIVQTLDYKDGRFSPIFTEFAVRL